MGLDLTQRRLPKPRPYGDIYVSRAAPFRSIRPESNIQLQVRASAGVPGLELAATDEKNLSTPQSPTQTHAWLSRQDGDAWRAQRAQTPPHQRAETACDLNTTEATRLIPVPRPRFAFRAADRLHRRAEFLRVQRRGARFQTDHFVVYAARLPESDAVRLGTTVSRRLGKAVIRNQIKRRIRECFRLSLRQKLPAGTAVVIIGRSRAGALEMRSMMGELDRAVAKVVLNLKQHHE
jgi:ribonuclease P protein component